MHLVDVLANQNRFERVERAEHATHHERTGRGRIAVDKSQHAVGDARVPRELATDAQRVRPGTDDERTPTVPGRLREPGPAGPGDRDGRTACRPEVDQGRSIQNGRVTRRDERRCQRRKCGRPEEHPSDFVTPSSYAGGVVQADGREYGEGDCRDGDHQDQILDGDVERQEPGDPVRPSVDGAEGEDETERRHHGAHVAYCHQALGWNRSPRGQGRPLDARGRVRTCGDNRGEGCGRQCHRYPFLLFVILDS